MEQKNKIFVITYALALAGMISGLLMAIYNLTFATAGITMPEDVEKIFNITNILCVVMIVLLVFLIIFNVYLRDKYYWLEIAFAGLIVITLIVLMSLCKKSVSVSAFQMVWFEIISSCVLLILSKVCLKFGKKKEVGNEEK